MDFIALTANPFPVASIVTVSPARTLGTDRILGLHLLDQFLLLIVSSSLEVRTVFDCVGESLSPGLGLVFVCLFTTHRTDFVTPLDYSSSFRPLTLSRVTFISRGALLRLVSST